MKKKQKAVDIFSDDVDLIIGLMSGTSLDGLDIALCAFRNEPGKSSHEVVHFETVPIPLKLKNRLSRVIEEKVVSLEEITLLNTEFGIFSGRAVAQFLKKRKLSPDAIELVVSHGQTLYHAPGRKDYEGLPLNATLQIGDGDHIAQQCTIPVLCDLRQKHIAAGGEGAPLAIYYDALHFAEEGKMNAALNLGGIANVTLLDNTRTKLHYFTTDCGPANTLLDAWTKKHYALDYDENGAIAALGSVHESLLETFLKHDFFARKFPKSTGREEFNLTWVESCLSGLNISSKDVLATLTELTAISVAKAVSARSDGKSGTLFVSGGGVHNGFLVRRISERLPEWNVESSAENAVDPDAKEAALFALLGNEYMQHPNEKYPWGPAGLGKLCLP